MRLKLLIKNASIYGIGNVLLRIAAFLPIPLYTRFLTDTEYGLLDTLLLTIQIMAIVINLGMSAAFMMFYKKYSSNNKQGELLGSTLLVCVVSGILISSAMILALPKIFSYFLDDVPGYSMVFAASCSAVFQTLAIQLLTYFRSQEKSGVYTVLCVILAVLILLSIILVLIVLNCGIEGILFAQAFSNALFFLSLLVYIKQKERLIVKLNIIKEVIPFGLPYVLVAGWIFMRIADRYFIGYFDGLAVVALYSLGFRVSSIFGVVITRPFELAFYPYVFARSDSHEELRKILSRSFSYLALISVLGGFFIIMFSKYIVSFLGPEVYSGSYIAVIWSLPIFLISGLYIWINAILQILKKTHICGITILAAVIINIALNIYLIDKFSWKGAVLSTLIAYIFTIFILYYYSLRRFSINFEYKRLFRVACIAVMLGICAYLYFNISGYFFVPSIIAGAVLPFRIGFFNDDEIKTLRSSLPFGSNM
ncbi:MAG: oligosaccharide flippase family protein [bacterium]|nr:oligosaccharide flippase family protein [bacterium]